MNAQQLFLALEKIKPEDRANLEVMARSHGPIGNCESVDFVSLDSYGFFGQSIPALFLNNERHIELVGRKRFTERTPKLIKAPNFPGFPKEAP